VHAYGGVCEDGDDKLLARHGEEEDAAKDGEGLVEQLGPDDAVGARILELVAERGTKDEIDKIGPGEVVGIRDATERRRQLHCEIVAETAYRVARLVRVRVGMVVLLDLLETDSGAGVSHCGGSGCRLGFV
jgi:hypothetical protein